MIKKNRGVIFGTQGPSMGQKVIRAANPFRAMSNMPTQFGRSAQTKQPKFGKRTRTIRRR